MTVPSSKPAVEAWTGGRRMASRWSLSAAYYPSLIGAAVLVTALVPAAIAPTLLGALAAWGVLAFLLRVNRRAAGQGLVAAVTVVLLVRNYAGLTIEARCWAIVTLLVLAAPFALFPLSRLPGFPFLHIWCVLEGVYIYVSFLLSAPLAVHTRFYTPEVRTTGYRLLATFTCLLIGGGLAVLRALSVRPSAHPTPVRITLSTPAVPRAYALAGGALLAVSLVGYLDLDERIGQLGELLSALGFGAGLILALVWLDGRLAPKHKPGLVVAVGLLGLVGLGHGALYRSAIPGLLVFALWLGFRRRVPWFGLLVALVVIVLLNVGKSDFRQEVAWDPQQAGPRSSVGVEWIGRTVRNLGSTDDDKIRKSTHRFANSDLLGYVATWAPERYPYFGHRVYTDLVPLMIPRVILPSKGTFNISNEFGRRYELIAPSDRATAVNTPLHVEAYLAGGIPILALVAFISGAFLAWLGWLLRGPDPATLLTGVLVAPLVMSTVESGILGLTSVVPFVLVLRPVMRWACASGRRSRTGLRSRAATPSLTMPHGRVRSSRPRSAAEH